MEPQQLTAALLFLSQQYKAGRLTVEQHAKLKTQLLAGDVTVKSAMVDAASGAVDLGTLLQRLHLGPSSSTATDTNDTEVLRAPLAFFARAFREVSQGRRAEDLCEDWGAAERLLASLNPLGGWEAVPLLSSLRDDEIYSGRLVRYRGMVQDMFDPEFYISVYEQEASGGRELRTGMFSDTVASEGMHPDRHKLSERQLLYCIPVPAESAWAALSRAPHAPRPSEAHSAAARHMDVTPASAEPVAKPPQATKRAMAADEDEADEAAVPVAAAVTAEERQKRNKSQANAEAQRLPDPSLVKASFPVPSSGPVCLAKIYEAGADFKLNEVIEFIGVLSINPELVSFDQETDDFLDPSSALPPSLVPRVHAVLARRANQATPIAANVLRDHLPVADLRRHTIELLARFLRGDQLAAEYLLLNMISKVHSRQAAVTVGKFVLNISGMQPQLVRPLEALMKQLVPRCCYFPLTAASMDSCNISPKKDHKSNKLISGLLQLTEGTHVVIDETQITSGSFSERGRQNLTALKHALENQRVQYDFSFHHLEFDINLPVLVLSKSKAMLPSDCLVPLRPADAEAAAAPEVPREGLDELRVYLQAARHTEFAIDPEVTTALEEEFVKARQQPNSPAGPELLHYWLTLGRLLAASYGEPTLTIALWKRVQELEAERKRRMR